jgi:hypothetical protein
MTLTANPHEMLLKAAEIISERGQSYGGIEENFQLIADMFTLRVGREFHPYEVCVLMECLKDARMFANPSHVDNYLDGINYKAFAAFFAQDYMNSRAVQANEIAYRRKSSLKQAEMKPVEVAKKGGRPLAVNLDEISENIARQA